MQIRVHQVNIIFSLTLHLIIPEHGIDKMNILSTMGLIMVSNARDTFFGPQKGMKGADISVSPVHAAARNEVPGHDSRGLSLPFLVLYAAAPTRKPGCDDGRGNFALVSWPGPATR